MSQTDERDWSGEPSDIVSRVQAITRENERLFKRVIAGEHRFRRLAKSVWQVQEEERRRLALELHDSLGQLLTALINQLKRAELAETPASPVGTRRSIELAESALDEVRRLSRMLRPPVLDDLGLHAALKWLARMLGESTGLEVEVGWKLGEKRLPTEVETLVFRTIQEALTNVVKHAHTSRAAIEVVEGREHISVRVVDEGRGFDAPSVLASQKDPGFGLRGMRDRVELFGGRLQVDTAPGRGCSLALEIPHPGGDTE